MMGHMGRAWARLLSYFLKDRTNCVLTPAPNTNTSHQSRQPIRTRDTTSDDEREINLDAMRAEAR